MKRIAVLLVSAAVVGGFLLGGRSSQPHVATAADVPATASGVVIDGLGRVNGTPDVLRVVLGVSVRRADLSRALADANTRQTRLTAVLRRHGVEAKDLQTADVSVDRAYDRRGRPNGYQVTETLTAKLRNLRDAGKAITDAVLAGGTEAVLQGVSFTLEDNAALLEQARDAAFADAKAKAERYAGLSHRTLGDVQLVTETTATEPKALQYAGGMPGFALAARPVPISPGTSEVTVTVTVRWALR